MKRNKKENGLDKNSATLAAGCNVLGRFTKLIEVDRGYEVTRDTDCDKTISPKIS